MTSSTSDSKDSAKREAYLQRLRGIFKVLNKVMVFMWRIGLGRMMNLFPHQLGRFVVLVHTGRKTGKERLTPVNYAPAGDDIHVTAGFGAGSHWYKNIMAQPDIKIWLPDGRYYAHAEDITDSPDGPEIVRAVLINSGFAARLFEGLRPRQMEESELRALIVDEGYRILRIQRGERIPRS